MKTVVLDASFVLKWILTEKEEGVLQARELHSQIIRGEIRAIAPEIILAEIVNVMFWKNKFENIDILNFVGMLQDGRVGLIPIDQFNFQNLLQIMSKKKITIFDAYYVSLAETNECEIMSFDKKLTDKR